MEDEFTKHVKRTRNAFKNVKAEFGAFSTDLRILSQADGIMQDEINGINKRMDEYIVEVLAGLKKIISLITEIKEQNQKEKAK